MPESFGAHLRQRREQRQISLSTIAEQTKIKLSLLESLERGDVSHWPSGIFRRAFIRAYAHAIGLEPDVVVREFLEVYPDPPEVVEPVPAIVAAVDGPSGGGAPTRLRYLVASAVGSLARRRPRTAPEPVATAAIRTPGEPREPAVTARPEEAVLPQVETIVQPAHAEQIDLPAVAELCTQLGKVASTVELAPLLTPSGCMGVLALELHKKNEERESVRAAATIIAAQLATLIGAAAPSADSESIRSA